MYTGNICISRAAAMDGSMKTTFMAVSAVSGSVAFLAILAHKRLLSDFMAKLESQTRNSKAKDYERKKKAKFGGRAAAPVAGEGVGKKTAEEDEVLESMPGNWRVMYRGILQHRKLKALEYACYSKMTQSR